MAAPRQGLPVRLDRAPQRGAVFALTRASRRARTRSIGSRSRARGLSLIFDHHRAQEVYRSFLTIPPPLILRRPLVLLVSCRREPCTGRSAWLPLGSGGL